MLNKDTRAIEMDEERFEDLLDRHGGEARRWPAEHRAAAAALLARSAAARALLAEAADLDALLRAGVPQVSPQVSGSTGAMAARAMRAPQRRAAAAGARMAFGGFGLAAALVLAAGVVFGLGASGAGDGLDEAPAQVLASALDARSGGDVSGGDVD